MPEGEKNGMAKQRIPVLIAVNDDGSPVYKWIQGNGQNEVNDRIVQAYIDSGRIWEFMDTPHEEPHKHSITFAVYVEKWITIYKTGRLKPSTIATYKKHLHAHVLPAFGEREIASITTEDIQLFLGQAKMY